MSASPLYAIVLVFALAGIALTFRALMQYLEARRDRKRKLVLFRDMGTTCEISAYSDTATGAPIAPNGGDITAGNPPAKQYFRSIG